MFITKISKNNITENPSFLNHKRERKKDSNYINNKILKQSENNHCILKHKSFKNKIKKNKIINHQATLKKCFNSKTKFINIKNNEQKKYK